MDQRNHNRNQKIICTEYAYQNLHDVAKEILRGEHFIYKIHIVEKKGLKSII